MFDAAACGATAVVELVGCVQAATAATTRPAAIIREEGVSMPTILRNAPRIWQAQTYDRGGEGSEHQPRKPIAKPAIQRDAVRYREIRD